MTERYGPPPGQQSGGVGQEDRNWALASHIGALVAAWFALGFLAPLVVMLVKSDSPFVRRHAVESLNFQISLLIYALVGGVVGVLVVVVTLGIAALVVVPLVLLLALAALWCVILATIRASNGEDYRYPLTIRFVS